MASNFTIAFLLTLGSTAWIYNKFANRSGGGNIKPAIIGSAVVGVVMFVIIYLVLGMVLNK